MNRNSLREISPYVLLSNRDRRSTKVCKFSGRHTPDKGSVGEGDVPLLLASLCRPQQTILHSLLTFSFSYIRPRCLTSVTVHFVFSPNIAPDFFPLLLTPTPTPTVYSVAFLQNNDWSYLLLLFVLLTVHSSVMWI